MEERGFTNRLDVFTLAAAMVVWSAHFMLLWIASIALPAHPAARWIGGVLTLAAFAALWFLWRRAGRPAIVTLPGLGIALATVGTFYGVLPALLS